MGNSKKEKLGLVFLLFLIFIFAFAPMSFAAGSFKIGQCASVTGSLAKPGAAVIRGAKLAVEEINSAGGVAGLKLDLLIGDSRCVPTEGINVAERFVENDKVDVLMGELCSSTTIAVLEVVKRTKMPLVVTTSTAPVITAPDAPTKGYVFRLVPTNEVLADQLAGVIIDELKFKNIASITNVGNEWAVTFRDLFKDKMKQRGLSLVTEQSVQFGETDFYSIITKVKAAKPDAVFLSMAGTELVNSVRQIYESGLKAQLFTGQAGSDPATVKAMGKAAEGMITLSFYEPTNLSNAVSIQFTKSFKKAYPAIDPGLYDAQGYDGIYCIADAIKRTKGDKGKFLSALKNTKGLQGIIGVTSFDENGQAHKKVLMVRIEGGKKVIME